MISKKSTVLSIICILIAASAILGATIIDRTPEGISIGRTYLPDTIAFDPKTLDKLTCFAPTVTRPLYEIAIPIGDWQGGSGASISSVTINGVKYPPGNMVVYSRGIVHAHPVFRITKKGQQAENIIVLVKALWHNNERIEAVVEIEHPEHGETRTIIGQAPSKGGLPEGTVHYDSFVLVEEAGLDRQHEPVETLVSAYPEEVSTPDEQGGLASELRLYRITENGLAEPVPIQVFDVSGAPGVKHSYSHGRWKYLESASKTARIIFFARVPANQSVPYVITYGSSRPPAPPAPSEQLDIKGKAPGFTISNSFYTCTLDPKSGLIVSIKLNGQANQDIPAITNGYPFPICWDPGSYGSNKRWGHIFRWDPPDRTVIAANGPLLLRVTSSGRMPGETPHVFVSVSYSFYAETPYIGVSTVMEVRDQYSASALRTGQLAICAHLATHFVWKDKAGRINRMPTLAWAATPVTTTTMAEPDIPWAAMTNEYDGYGIAAIWTVADAYHKEKGTRPIYRPAYCFQALHYRGTPITYMARPWVWPYGYKDHGPTIMVEPGAVFYDRGAFYVFRFKRGDGYESVEHINTLLSQPLCIKIGN